LEGGVGECCSSSDSKWPGQAEGKGSRSGRVIACPVCNEYGIVRCPSITFTFEVRTHNRTPGTAADC